jgi:peptide/nickel transport system substrate-binding protein
VPTAEPEGEKMGMGDMAFIQDGKTGGLPLPMYNYAYASHWDLHVAPALDSTRAARPLYSGLVHYDFRDPRVVTCDLCENWTLGEDGLTYTFKLNPKATFSNGEKVTAEDVVFSLNRMVEEGEPRPRAGAIKPYYKSSTVIDETTVELATKFQAAAFLKFLALDYMTILNKKHVQNLLATDAEKLDLAEGVLGSGGFIDAGVKVGEAWTIERNPNYWKPGLPFLDQVQTIVVRGRSNQLASMLAGQTLGSLQRGGGVTAKTQDNAIKEGGGELRPSIGLTGPIAAFVNHLNPPFDNEKVRQAMFLLINREAFKVGLYDNNMWPGSYFGPGIVSSEADIANRPGYRNNPDGSKLQEDIDAARGLLTEAGYSESNPVKFKIMVRTVSIYPTAAVFLKEQFELSKMAQVEIEEVESVAGITRQGTGEFQMSYRIIATLTDDPDGVFSPIYLPGGSENPLNYEDPRVKAIFEQQTKELDPAKRLDFLKQAEDIFMEGKSQWFTVGWGPSFGVLSAKLRNFGSWPGEYGDYLAPGDLKGEMDHVWYDAGATYDPNNPPTTVFP